MPCIISLKELLFFISICHISKEMKDILEEIQPSEDNPSDLNAFFEDVMKFKKAFKMIRRAAAESDGDAPMSRDRRDHDIDEYVYDEDNFVLNTKKTENEKHTSSNNKKFPLKKSNRPLNDIYPHIYKDHLDQEYADKYLETFNFDKGPRYRRQLIEDVQVEPKSTKGYVTVEGDKATMINNKNKVELMENDAHEALMTIFSQLGKSTHPANEGTTQTSSKSELPATATLSSQNTISDPVSIILATTRALNSGTTPTPKSKPAYIQKDMKRELKIDIMKNGKLIKEFSSNENDNETIPCIHPKQTSISLKIEQSADAPNIVDANKERVEGEKNRQKEDTANLEHFENVQNEELPLSASKNRRTYVPDQYVRNIPKFVGNVIDEIQTNYRRHAPKMTRSHYHYGPYMEPIYSEDPRSDYYAKHFQNMIYNRPYFQQAIQQNLENEEDENDVRMEEPQVFRSRSLKSWGDSEEDLEKFKRNIQEMLGMDNEDDYIEDLAFKTESPSTIKYAEEDDEISVRSFVKSKNDEAKITSSSSTQDLQYITSTPATVLTTTSTSATSTDITTQNIMSTKNQRKKRARKYGKMKERKLLSRLRKGCKLCQVNEREHLAKVDKNAPRSRRQRCYNFKGNQFGSMNHQGNQDPSIPYSRSSMKVPRYRKEYFNNNRKHSSNDWCNYIDPLEIYQKMRYFHFRPYQYQDFYPNNYEGIEKGRNSDEQIQNDEGKRCCDCRCCRKLMSISNPTTNEHTIQKRDIIDAIDEDEAITEIIQKRTESDYGDEPDLSEGQNFKKHTKLKKHNKVMAPSRNFDDNYEYEEVPKDKTNNFLGVGNKCNHKKKCKKKKYKLKKAEHLNCQVSFKDRLARLRNKLFSNQLDETENTLRDEISHNQYDDFRRSERQSEPTRLEDQDYGSSKRIEAPVDSDNKRQCYDPFCKPLPPCSPLFPPCQRHSSTYPCSYEPCPCDPCPSEPCPSEPTTYESCPCQPPYCTNSFPPRPSFTYPSASSEPCSDFYMPCPPRPCPCQRYLHSVPFSSENVGNTEPHIKERCPSAYFDPCPPGCPPPCPCPYPPPCSCPCPLPPPCTPPCITSDDKTSEGDYLEDHIISERSPESIDSDPPRAYPPSWVPKPYQYPQPCFGQKRRINKRETEYRYQEMEGRYPPFCCDQVVCPYPCPTCPCPPSYPCAYPPPHSYAYPCCTAEDFGNLHAHDVRERCSYPCPDPCPPPCSDPSCCPCPCPCSLPCPSPIPYPCTNPCPYPCPPPCFESEKSEFVDEKSFNLRDAPKNNPSVSNESGKNEDPKVAHQCFSNCPPCSHANSFDTDLPPPPSGPPATPPCPSAVPPCIPACPPCPPTCTPCPPTDPLSPVEPPTQTCPPCTPSPCPTSPPACSPCPLPCSPCPPQCPPCSTPTQLSNQSCSDPCEPQIPDDDSDDADIYERNERSKITNMDSKEEIPESAREFLKIENHDIKGRCPCPYPCTPCPTPCPPYPLPCPCPPPPCPFSFVYCPCLSSSNSEQTEDHRMRERRSNVEPSNLKENVKEWDTEEKLNDNEDREKVFSTRHTFSEMNEQEAEGSNVQNNSFPLPCHHHYISSPYFTTNEYEIHNMRKRSNDQCPPGYILLEPHYYPGPNICPEIPCPSSDLVYPSCAYPLPQPIPISCPIPCEPCSPPTPCPLHLTYSIPCKRHTENPTLNHKLGERCVLGVMRIPTPCSMKFPNPFKSFGKCVSCEPCTTCCSNGGTSGEPHDTGGPCRHFPLSYGWPCPFSRKRSSPLSYPCPVVLLEPCSLPELNPLPSSSHYPSFPVPCALTFDSIPCPCSYLGKRSNCLIPYGSYVVPMFYSEQNNGASETNGLKQEAGSDNQEQKENDHVKTKTEEENNRVKRHWLCPRPSVNHPQPKLSQNCLNPFMPPYYGGYANSNDPYSSYQPRYRPPCYAQNCVDGLSDIDSESEGLESGRFEAGETSDPNFQSQDSELSCPPWYWNCDIVGPYQRKCPNSGNRLSIRRRSNTVHPGVVLPSTASASDLISTPGIDEGDKEKRKCPKPCEPLPPRAAGPPPLPLPCDDTTNDMLAQRAKQVNDYLKNQYLSGRYTMSNRNVPRNRRQLPSEGSSMHTRCSRMDPLNRKVRRPHGVPKKPSNRRMPPQNEDIKYLDYQNIAETQEPLSVRQKSNRGINEEMGKIQRRNCNSQSNPDTEGKSKSELSPEDFMLLKKKSSSEYQDMTFAKEIVEAVMNKVNKNTNLKIKIGNALNKKRIYETENSQRNFAKACTFEERSEYEEAKNLLKSVSCVLNKLVKKQIEEKLCEKLPAHLKNFLKRIVRPPKHRINQRHDDKYHEDTFLFRASCPPAKLDPDMRSKFEVNLVKLLDRYNQLDEDSRKRAAPLKSYISNHLDMLKKIEGEQTESSATAPEGYMEEKESLQMHPGLENAESESDSSLNSRNSLNNLDIMEKDLENLDLDKKRTSFQQPAFGMNSLTPVKITEEESSIENKLKKRNTDKSKETENSPHKRETDDDSTSDKYKKLVKAAEEVRIKRKNEEKIGEAFGNKKVDENDPDAKEQDDQVAFETPLVFRT